MIPTPKADRHGARPHGFSYRLDDAQRDAIRRAMREGTPGHPEAWTQSELATAVGVGKSAISRVLDQRRPIYGSRLLPGICRALGLPSPSQSGPVESEIVRLLPSLDAAQLSAVLAVVRLYLVRPAK